MTAFISTTPRKSFRTIRPWPVTGCLLFATLGMFFFGCDPVVIPPDPELVCRDLMHNSCNATEAPAEIVAACNDFLAGRLTFAERCPSANQPEPWEEAQVILDNCIAIAMSRGVTLTPTDIRACGEQVAGWPCTRGQTYPCLGLSGDLLYPNHDKRGTLALGESCIAQVQCASGYCDHEYYGSACGTCKRGRAEGESCTDATDVCMNYLECSDGICQTPGIKLGEHCSSKSDQCQSGLYCDTSAPSYLDHTCAAYRKAGESCDTNAQCANELFCQNGTCTLRGSDGTNCTDHFMCASHWCNNGVCAVKPLPPADLTEGQDCSVGSCREDLYCYKDVCIAATYLAEGDACTRDAFPMFACNNGLYCDQTCTPSGGCQGTCRPFPKPGEPCTNFAACGKDAYCTDFGPDVSKSRCVKLGSVGEPCPCAHGLACLAGQCVKYGMCE